MNLIFSNADGDILITTDDDAIPSKNWVEDHVKIHNKYSELGVAGPIISNWKSKISIIKKIYSIIMEKPLDERMRDYTTYFANTGIFVSNPLYKLANLHYIKSFSFMGVNMSAKREVYKDFRLLPMTLRGIGYEQYLCLHSFRKGFISANFMDCCKIYHEERDSLSRPKSLNGIKERYAEMMLSVYYLSRFYKINLSKLKIDIKLKTFSWELHKKSEIEKAMLEGIKIGLKISLEAIQNNYDHKWIREKLKEI